jgi:flagellar basal-body rod modification protein FlgD
MAITSTDVTQAIDSYTGSINPKSILGKDDFMKLLLAELQHQDPTSPMDSDKILSQTSDLAQLESQEKTNDALEKLAASLSNSKNFSAVSAIGKMARMTNEVNLKNTTDGKPSPVNFSMDFEDDIKSGNIYIYDEQNRLVNSMEIKPQSAGSHTFNWDGKTTTGDDAKSGKYKIIAKYQNNDGLNLEGKFGAYKIEAVKFEDEKTFVKVNGAYTSFENVSELYDEPKS